MNRQQQAQRRYNLQSLETSLIGDIHETGTAPLIRLSDVSVPIAILSVDDGVVAYANQAFRDFNPAISVGKPINGFLNTEQKRASINKELLSKDKVVNVFETDKYILRFNVTSKTFSGTNHYLVMVEKVAKAKLSTPLEKLGNHQSVTKDTPLTRAVFLDSLLASLKEKQSNDFSLCAIDIDRFKVINEKYGYLAGDYVLKEISKLLNDNVADEYIIGRLGDNEFGLFLARKNLDEAVHICEEIRQKIKQFKFFYNDEQINVTVSIGVIPVDKQQTIENILAQSELALSAAKENGRNCVHSSATQDTMMVYQSGKMHYAVIIEDALQNDKFELFAQPIVDLSNPHKHYSYEVLLRIYDHNKKSLVSSQELITVAESLEVTTKIDEYVCEKVFALLQDKVDKDVRIPNISINLSGHSIVNQSFERFLLELTQKYSVPSSCICFEITESVAVKSISRAQNFIKNLKNVGYKFSLDDFGVGYCSFNYLNQLDVDNVKIDGSFVSAMLDDATQFATVQAITNVARTMNVKTIAEFVEKPDIIKALKVIGVDYGQGYIFGKPKEIDTIFQNATK